MLLQPGAAAELSDLLAAAALKGWVVERGDTLAIKTLSVGALNSRDQPGLGKNTGAIQTHTPKASHPRPSRTNTPTNQVIPRMLATAALSARRCPPRRLGFRLCRPSLRFRGCLSAIAKGKGSASAVQHSYSESRSVSIGSSRLGSFRRGCTSGSAEEQPASKDAQR